ncbi:MAG: PKD domain-containing protein [Actinomycetes bacterium]
MKRFSSLLVVVAAAVLVAGACAAPAGPIGQSPTVTMSADPTSGSIPLTVNFFTSATSVPAGSELTYSWSFGDGSAASTDPSPTHVYTAAGSYTATVTVTDATGRSTLKSVTISAELPPNEPPIAVIGATPVSGKGPLVVAFSSAGSVDGDGAIAAYDLDFGDGTAHSTSAGTAHTYAAVGSYVATLTVTDDRGATNSATKIINVTPNQAPTAVASGTPTAGKEPLTVAFSSAGSSDSDGSVASYSWNFGDGGTSTAPNPSHTYANPGDYTATLTVTDDNGDTGADTVAITVNANQKPTAIANATPPGGIVPLTVSFTGSGSTDPDGSIQSYAWTFGDGNSSSLPNPTYTYGAIGSYLATLIVTDDNGATDSTTVTITVNGVPNQAPTASASATPTSGKEPLTVALSSSGSIDPDGSIQSYIWDFGDGTPTSSLANPSHIYAAAGNYTAQLTVYDNRGATGSAAVTVSVTPNQAPTAKASGTPTSGKEPLTVSFASTGSTDPDGTIVSRQWDFGDGGTSSAASPSHVYASAGSYTATLTVTDDNGATATDTVAIVAIANQKPTAVANATPQSGSRPLTVNFSGSSSADPDGTLVSYAWNFGDGTSGSGMLTSHVYAVGNYTATLTVTDDNGATDTSTIGITVVIDDDGDGVSPPTDCNDSNASVYPGAADQLDATALDSNCDGADGVVSDTVFVSTAGSDTSSTCSLAAPCQTIARGITVAGTSKHVVQVSNGAAFAGFSVSGTSGLTIRGGYATNFASRSGTTTSTGGVSLSSTTSLTLSDLTIVGPGGSNTTGVIMTGGSATLSAVTVSSGTASGSGSSAYGVRALSSANLTVKNSAISASAGVAGVAGTTPSGALTAGNNGQSGGGGDTHYVPPGTSGGTGIANGGGGGQGQNSGGGGAAGSGTGAGAGGYAGCDNCRSNSSYSGGGGGAGGGGTSGANGTNGLAGALAYGSTFSPSAATGGGTGGNGAGGGGGGGGGRACDAGLCAGQWTGGGAGGGGGGGGQGGSGGSAGTAGGGSFAVYSYNSTVTIDANTTITAASGGTGGNGGTGQNGASGGYGGNGGAGHIADCCTGSPGSAGGGGAPGQNGGNGGNGAAGTCCNAASGGGAGGGGGGNGGRGGSGGGGAGGPSVGLMKVGTGSITFGGNTSTQITIGTGGSGGSSANGGNAGATGPASKSLTA